MKPAWGNPQGLKVRSIGEKEDNLFVAEFGVQHDMERALGGSPWVVGRHALLLQPYDEAIRPSEIKFDQMDIWVRILNLPLGWMNQHRGERAMGLVGTVKKMDVDKDDKASGAWGSPRQFKKCVALLCYITRPWFFSRKLGSSTTVWNT